MKTKLVLLIGILGVSAFSAEPVIKPAKPDTRWTFEAFGTERTAFVNDDESKWKHPGSPTKENERLGAGIGVGYDITPKVGVLAEAISEDMSGAFVERLQLSLVARGPIWNKFQPYALGGSGHMFDDQHWYAQFGAGIEYKITKNFSPFIDARWLTDFDDSGEALFRFGLRLRF